MTDHVWSVLCSKSITDAATNQISLIETIEKITAHMPIPPEGEGVTASLPMHLVSLWIRSELDTPEEGISRIMIEGPGGYLSAAQEVAINLKDNFRVRNLIQMDGIPIRGPGVYNFLIQLRDEADLEAGWVTCAKIPLEVEFNEPTQ